MSLIMLWYPISFKKTVFSKVIMFQQFFAFYTSWFCYSNVFVDFVSTFLVLLLTFFTITLKLTLVLTFDKNEGGFIRLMASPSFFFIVIDRFCLKLSDSSHPCWKQSTKFCEELWSQLTFVKKWQRLSWYKVM